MKHMRAFSFSIFFLFVLMSLVTAASLPTNNPFRLEGGFTVNGIASTEDHTFSAYVDGELYKTLETGSDGYYVLTVGGADGDQVSLSIDGTVVYSGVTFESYGTHFQNVDISSSSSGGSGSGGSGGGSGGSGGSSSSSGGGSSGGGGSSSSFRDEEEDTFILDEEVLPEESTEDGIDVLVGETNTTQEEETQSGLSSITGAAILQNVKDFGVDKILFIVLALVVLTLAYRYYRNRKKKAPETPVNP